jgi:hypothetical protein
LCEQSEIIVVAYQKQGDLTGFKNGKMTFIGFSGKENKKGEIWIAQCECGNYENRYRKSIKNLEYDCCHPCQQIESQQRKKCGDKRKYHDVVAANQAKTKLYLDEGFSKILEVYKCCFCDCYHIGHNGLDFIKIKTREIEMEFKESTLDWTF